MAKIKVYGVMGLIEWKPVIHIGQATFCPLFTGGSVSGFGITPATYKTSNPAEQHIIEHSSHFKSGRITLRYTLDAPTLQEEGDEVEEVANDSAAHQDKDSVELPPNRTKKTEDPSISEEKEFGSLSDARAWLFDTYGIDKSSVITKAAVAKAARAKGVKVTFTD